MPRVAGRGFKGRGELEAGLDADFEGEVVAIFEIVVSDPRSEDSEEFEGPIEVYPWCYRVVGAKLTIEAKLECTTAVVGLDIGAGNIDIIYIKLLPDGTDATTNKRLECSRSRPSCDCANLNRNLNKFTICRASVGPRTCKGSVGQRYCSIYTDRIIL